MANFQKQKEKQKARLRVLFVFWGYATSIRYTAILIREG
jgi:hypothetical protein